LSFNSWDGPQKHVIPAAHLAIIFNKKKMVNGYKMVIMSYT